MGKAFSYGLGLLSIVTACRAQQPMQTASTTTEIQVGMTDTAAYFPLLRGQRVAVLANHTSVAVMPSSSAPVAPATATAELEITSGKLGITSVELAPNIPPKMIHPMHPDQQPPSSETVAAAQAPGPQQRVQPHSAQLVHLVDLLHAQGFDVTGIFSPEHGFRGTADAGEHVGNSVDPATGIPIRSLYDGNTRRPSDETMRSFDVLVVDMQDVGLRFYTYYITMLRMMDACAAYGHRVVVLDRPNPNGDKVDGPLLQSRYYSGVGALPIPVLHGLTMGEIARMAVGEGWAKPCDLTIVPCRNYTHSTPYELPVPPSPNLRTQRAVYLYASLCLFEGTSVSVGRGTDRPFEVYGHPGLADYPYRFTPRPTAGAKHPLHEGKTCRGEDLGNMSFDEARATGFSLRWLIDACRALGRDPKFFNPMFEKLVGVDYVREMILAGADEADIRARWEDELKRYRQLRRSYLLYEE